jgi:beta-lactamase class A
MTLRRVCLCALASFACLAPLQTRAAPMPGPLLSLQLQLNRAAQSAPGRVGIAVEDLATGEMSGVNASASLPAASTIKIPVMVEVFRQMSVGSIDLNTRVHLVSSDRDWGWGDMADASPGTSRTVSQLLRLMIDESDNTATNMLIRLVGRVHVNQTMAHLGLRKTRLGDYIRSATDDIRYALRSSPRDMVKLLDDIAREKLVDAWSSREMLSILAGQTHNSLLPVPLPPNVRIAHKTGSLHDTLDDVGIVYHDEEPYVIAVMTTQLVDLEDGRRFIHRVSRIAYDQLTSFGTQRAEAGFPPFAFADPISRLSPDQLMWRASSASALDPDAGAGETRLPPAGFEQPHVLPAPPPAQPEDSEPQD